jgi:precorrin-8X/cobalt-precorrin-8 methylmutase
MRELMPLFERYIAVDWSGNNSPTSGKDSIWIGEALRQGEAHTLTQSVNPTTRNEAIAVVEERLRDARAHGERVLVGFDFAFGYPKGAAHLISGQSSWRGLWQTLSQLISDGPDNKSNNYEVADRLNAGFPTPGPRFWGRPAALPHVNLLTNKSGANFDLVAEKRIVEGLAKGTKAIWQLHYNGAVGSQALLGIPRLEQLRQSPRIGQEIAVWPFETDFERRLSAPIVIAEIYPSLFEIDPAIHPRDRAQVEAVASGFARFDVNGQLGELLAAPSHLTPEDRDTILREEGWIVGAGRTDLKPVIPSVRRKPAAAALAPDAASEAASRPPAPKDFSTYIRDPAAIYAESFATIRREADLDHLPEPLRDPAIRMIHASGMVDLSADIAGTADLPQAVRDAILSGAPILCDCEMVRAGIIRRRLPDATELVVTLNAPEVPALAAELGTTRSAAAVELWLPRLAGAVVVIGNAPTALFHLIEKIAGGAPRPAAIIATPVGFVGAAESKAMLATNPQNVPFLTVRGRRGGSAMASAALNGIVGGLAA